MKLFKPALLILAALLAAGGVFVASGVYDVGADSPHTRPVEWLLAALRAHSTEAHGEAVRVPPLDDPRLAAEGAEHYAAMCSGCHLAPGMAQTELRAGLYPRPPLLYQQQGEAPGERFWIIKHGIKFTGMPAWGPTHDDQAIWAMVAFLQQLPGLTPEQYARMTAHAGDEHEHHQDEAH